MCFELLEIKGKQEFLGLLVLGSQPFLGTAIPSFYPVL